MIYNLEHNLWYYPFQLSCRLKLNKAS